MTTIKIPTVMRTIDLTALKKLGFCFTDPKGEYCFNTHKSREEANGPLEQEVTLPKGWGPHEKNFLYPGLRILIDDRGRGRAGVFPAGENKNMLRLFYRYRVDSIGVPGTGLYVYVLVDRINEQEVFRGRLAFSSDSAQDKEAASREFIASARQHFPQMDDLTAYWDD